MGDTNRSAISINILFNSDLLLKSQPIYNFNDQISLNTITSKKLVVRTNKINQIELNQLLNATSATKITGSKVFASLKVKDLMVTQTMNNLPLDFLNPSSPEKPESTEAFDFLGDINIKHLQVKSLNGFNVSAVLQDVFVTKESNIIHGNLVLQNVTNVEQMIVDSVMDLPVDNLLTKSTQQTVAANMFISKFYAEKLETKMVNDENLSQNVAMINDANTIEGESN